MNKPDLTVRAPSPSQLDHHVEAFEAAGEIGPTAIARCLPARSDPLYLPVLCELVRIDLECHQTRGQARALESYREPFPELFDDPVCLRALVDEDRRQRLADGEAPASSEYRARFGVASSRDGATSGTAAVPVLPLAAHLEGNEPALPGVGEEFLGFSLERELGRGSFGCVFLARQKHLAGRPVALKVTTRPSPEPQRLARLQHTNIVPIYSVHNAPPLQAVCMPYFGRTTLADVLRAVRGQPSLPVSGTGLLGTCETRVNLVKAEPDTSACLDLPADAPQPIRDRLARLSYPDAVVWIGARLADGLAHAHERGILHRDLKPANVLLSDDGQPMLLDFNLAADARAPAEALLGGTVPYMAPEQMEAVAGRQVTVDERSDLFSLGVMLFELLAGRLPFLEAGRGPFDPDRMIAERRVGPPRLRALNPAVSPAIEAAVTKLLHPDPARRYADARQLQVDLDCHLQDEPLQYAPNPSPRERAAKWLRRHPRALPIGALMAVVALVIGLGITYASQSAARQREAALRQADDLTAVLPALRIDLNSATDPAVREAAVQRARETLEGYGLPDDTGWRDRPAFRALPPARQQQLERDVGEILVLLVHNGLRFGGTTVDNAYLLRLNHLAEACFAGAPPPLLWRQRATLGEADPDIAAKGAAKADDVRGLFLDGLDRISAGRYSEALPLLERAAAGEPGHYAAQFALAHCCHMLALYPRALERYDIARALRPDDPRTSHSRGLIFMLLKRYPEAESEFDDALRLNPAGADLYKNRGLARLRRGNTTGALADFDRSLENGGPELQVRLFRAETFDALRKPEEAQRDRAAANKCEPVGEGDLLARAIDRRRLKDLDGALKDFEAAVAKYPRSITVLQGYAATLSEFCHRNEDALNVLDRLIRQYPDFAAARSGKAVLLARLGRRTDAHREGREALSRNPMPVTYYQLTSIYALTMKDHPADRAEALTYFRKAVQAGYQNFFDQFETDADLDNLRGDKEFTELMAAVRKIYPQRPKR